LEEVKDEPNLPGKKSVPEKQSIV